MPKLHSKLYVVLYSTLAMVSIACVEQLLIV